MIQSLNATLLGTILPLFHVSYKPIESIKHPRWQTSKISVSYFLQSFSKYFKQVSTPALNY